MKIRQFEVWLADLNPRMGTEPGKVRPVLVVQTDLLNDLHPSTLVCPITTQVIPESSVLRINLRKGVAKLMEDCDVMMDQVRAIDNRRLVQKLGSLPLRLEPAIKESIQILFDL